MANTTLEFLVRFPRTGRTVWVTPLASDDPDDDLHTRCAAALRVKCADIELCRGPDRRVLRR